MANTRARCLRSLLLPVVALAASGCADPPQFLAANQAGGPAGILEGTVTYSGPLPCTESQHVLGAAVFLVFDARLLPPPDGLGTTAASLGALGGDQLFGGVVDRLTFNTDGSKWCPAATVPPVTVSGSWSVGPLPGGPYQVRAFYDLGGQFDPVFSITKLPHKGDVAGGAIDNVSAVLTGAAPVYRVITLGTANDDGSYTIPPTGSNIGGIAVTLGEVLPLGLPVFNPTEVLYSSLACQNGTVSTQTPKASDPTAITMSSDYLLPSFSAGDPAGTEKSLIRVGLTSGVAPSEVAAASASPFNLPVNPAPPFQFSWQDVNHDGMLDIGHDHVAASSLVPSLFPLSIFSKLASITDDLTPQATPAVIIQGLTIYKDLLTTVGWGAGAIPAASTPTDSEVIVGVTPAVLCLDPTDHSPTATATLVVTHLTDCTGNMILTDQQGTLDALAAQFGRKVNIAEGCLPQGRYAMNLVYGTGQAWTDANEAGVCQAGEPESADHTMCVASGPTGAQRARLSSQDLVLTIGPPDDPTYCAQPMHQTPSACCPAGVNTKTGACN